MQRVDFYMASAKSFGDQSSVFLNLMAIREGRKGNFPPQKVPRNALYQLKQGSVAYQLD